MKQSTKIIALVMSVLMICGIVQISGFADDIAGEETTFESGMNPMYKEAIETLIRFGIFESEDFETEKNITRGEFVGAAMKLTGSDAVFTPRDTPFSDVSSDNPNSGAIAAAVDMGIVSGFGDGTFGPDILITRGQAVKILVSILGYDVQAEAFGGYYTGYLSVAARQKITKNIDGEISSICTFAQAAQLIYNAMHTDVLQIETYPEGKYFTRSGENPMTLWMDIYECSGKVISNDITSISGADGTKEGNVVIRFGDSEQMFIENGTGAGELLGLAVDAYYKETANGKKLLLSVDVGSNVEEVSINAEDIETKSNETAVYWYDDDKDKEYDMKIEDTPSVIYNGKYYSKPLTSELLKPESGMVRLADTDGNGKADAVYVTDAEIYVVKSVSTSGVIKDKYNKSPIVLDLNSADTVLKITKYGEETSLGDIKENMVLTVTRSEDKKYIHIDVSTGKIKGTIDEMGEDYLVISGEKYKIVKSAMTQIQKLKPGYTTNFFLTSNDVIAGCSTTDAPGTAYGYAVIGGIKKSGLEDRVSLRVCTISGKIQEFELSDNLTLNDLSGNGKSSADLLKSMAVAPLPAPDAASGTQYVYCNQLIEYTINGDGKISRITTARDNTSYGKYTEDFSLDFSYRSSNNSSLLFREFGFIDGRFDATGCYGFKVPEQSVWQSLYDGSAGISLGDLEKQIVCFTTADWGDNYKIYNFDIYDLSEVKNCSVIVEYAKAQIVPELDLFLVDYVSQALDAEGVPTYKLNGIYKGQYVGYILDMEYLSESDVKLRQGDVVRIAADVTGSVREIYKIFTMKKADAGSWESGGYLLNGEEYNCYGHTATSNSPAPWSGYSAKTAYSANWNRLHVVMHGKYSAVVGTTLLIDFGYRAGQEDRPVDSRLLTDNERSKYYVYDEEKEEVRVGSTDDIDPDNPRQTVVVRNRYYENYEGIIINRKDDAGDIYWVGPFDE